MWKRVQWLLTLFIFIYCAGLTGPSKVPEGGVDPVAGRISVLMQMIVIPPFLLLMIVNKRKMLAGFNAAKLPLTMAFLLLFSTAWSLEPRFTLRRSLVFMFFTLFAIYIGACLTRMEQIEMYGQVVLATVLGCLLISIFLPEYGVSSDVHAGEWKGLFQHKNILGRQMVFCLALLIGAKPFRLAIIRWITIFIALLLLALSRSGTGLLGFLAVLCGYGAVKVIRIRQKNTLPLWMALAPLAIISILIALIFRDQLFAIIGKDSTLTGRTRIWAVAFAGMAERPLLGHGYGTFWRQSVIGRALPPGLQATHSHDGYFDVILDVGFVGFALFLATLYSYISRTLKKLLDQQTPLSDFTVLAFLFTFLFLALNFTESNLLREHTFLWLPFVSIYTAMGLPRTDPAEIRDATTNHSQDEVNAPVPQTA
jgi:exopolysaccharide production protein ExoQ